MIIVADMLVAAHGTVWIFEGTEEGTDDRFRFAADHRPAKDIAAAIDVEGVASCDVPSYMLMPATNPS